MLPQKGKELHDESDHSSPFGAMVNMYSFTSMSLHTIMMRYLGRQQNLLSLLYKPFQDHAFKMTETR